MYQFTVTIEDKEDAEFMVSSVKLVAATNNIKVEQVSELVELPIKILSDELREKILSDQDFLFDYAHTTFTGDGMEQEHAAELLSDEEDVFIVDNYLTMCRDNDDLLDELRKYPQFEIAFEDYDRNNRKEAE
jgi:hypothetical protein